MVKQPKDSCDGVLYDMDFRFRGAGIYGDHFYNQFFLDADGCFHMDDGPAFIDGEGNRLWFTHGLRNRKGGLPAYEGKNGDRAWYEDGVFHREGGPAIVYAEGNEEWWIKGSKLEEAEIKGYKEWLTLGKGTAFGHYLLHKEMIENIEGIVAEFEKGLAKPLKPMKPLPSFPR
ncbi:MAG: hypothetical protein EPN97_08645 [Alphaproteobacteria bacterium]|nr:MAG: hypothetical protein EPN97_08645 [Alphaproteobacteria bacterium]